ncbi:hypothetical protein TIFTF001_033525 [Ficus carica]|uniref:Uncharacterized protein n=1 Tax=Ficus carica TaxID=3494 RepID=A0AA88DYF5_FICCA|nr:hypothetical protein TIFTF001_033525 [Ficus carica]
MSTHCPPPLQSTVEAPPTPVPPPPSQPHLTGGGLLHLAHLTSDRPPPRNPAPR